MMSEPSVKDLFVLGRISQGPTYGHEIMRTIAGSQADLWLEISDKHVYYVLKKLERDGLVGSDAAPGEGPTRRVYRITEAGEHALAEWLASDVFVDSIPYSDFDAVVAMLGCTDSLSDEERTAVLRRRITELDRRLTEEYEPLMGRHTEQRSGATARALYDKGRTVTQGERAWLSALISEVERDGWGAFGVRA